MSFQYPGHDPLTLIELMVWAETSRWQFARTMAYNPHWYTLRKEQNKEMFLRVVRHMRDYGYLGRWGGSTYMYYDIGTWTFWTMGSTLDETVLINRKPKDKM